MDGHRSTRIICVHLCESMICFFRAVLLNALILDTYLAD
jgi:hypothetical protein